MNAELKTISHDLSEKQKNAVDIDFALSVSGIGLYNIKYSLVLSLFLVAAIIEPVGYSYVLPAARCDLQMTDTQRGVIGSIPYIGVVITSFPWGYLVDTRGRKKMIVISSLIAGALGILSAFMPNLISFVLIKCLMSLCIACPAAAPYSYIGEITPARYRDVTLSVTNAMQVLGSSLVPLIAWAILPLDFSVDFGSYYFRPWRLLTILYSLPFIIGGILMSFGPESPKYLIAKGKEEETLEVLKTIFSGNKRVSPESYPVKRLDMPPIDETKKPSFLNSIVTQSLPLLKPPYLKWLLLIGFLLFGLFATLNGLYIWLPDIINRVLTGGGESQTACEVIAQRLNETSIDGICDDTIDTMTFSINFISNICCAVIAIAASSLVKVIGKNTVIITVYVITGVFCILINFVTQDILFAIFISAMPITGLAIGPINAFSVQIFPTQLRGMAVSLSMMIGRTGSIVGSNIAGALINAACEATFYLFGGLLILCGLLSLLLLKAKQPAMKIDDTQL